MPEMLQLQLFRHFKFKKYFDSHGFASPMVQVVGPEVLPLGLSKKKKLCPARFGECVGKWRENSTVKFLCFTRRSVEGKKEHAPGWEFFLAFCWAQQMLEFQGVQTISTNGEDIFKATSVSEFEFAGRMKHKTVFGWLAIRSWTWWMVDQVSPSKQQKALDMQSNSVRSLVKLQLSAQCSLVFKEMKPQKMKRFPGWTTCWKKKGLWHLKPTFSRKISRVVKLCFFQVANKKPKTFSFCTLKQKVSWFQCGSSEDRWMPFIVDSVKRDLTSVATRQGHLWNLYWWLPNPGKWVEAQCGTSSWYCTSFFWDFCRQLWGVKT